MKQQTVPSLSELLMTWTRIRNKAKIMDSLPFHCGANESFTLSEIHVIRVIKNTPENNVRIIAGILAVTPSAASQMIKKLTKRGLVRKIRGVRNEKEVTLELTEKGSVVFDRLQESNAQVQKRIIDRAGKMDEDDRRVIGRVFSVIESLYDERIAELSCVTGSDVEELS